MFRVHMFRLSYMWRRVKFPRLISESSSAAPWQIRAIIRRGFMADTSRNNKEYPVSLPFLSNKSCRSRVYLSSTAWYVTSPLTLKWISPRSFILVKIESKCKSKSVTLNWAQKNFLFFFLIKFEKAHVRKIEATYRVSSRIWLTRSVIDDTR